MKRLPYDILIIEANQFIIDMATTLTWELAFECWDQYNNFIESCGWIDYEFDAETLKRVDATWEMIRRRAWN